LKLEWKPVLELVMLEARAGHVHQAAELAQRALEIHPGTGRLWAVYVQLCHRLDGLRFSASCVGEGRKDEPAVLSKHDALLRALRDVPKSGEVWAEGARCRLNPMHVASFDLGGSQKFLGFAAQFTPQYGDTFLEMLRVELLVQVVLPRVLNLLGLPVGLFLTRFVCLDAESDISAIMANPSARDAFVTHASGLGGVASKGFGALSAMLSMQLDMHFTDSSFSSVVLERLFRRCINAEPNYGTAWFFCRSPQTDTPAEVLRAAQRTFLVHELLLSAPLYARACCYYIRHCYANAYRGPEAVGATSPHVMMNTKAPAVAGPGAEQHEQMAREFLVAFRAAPDALVSRAGLPHDNAGMEADGAREASGRILHALPVVRLGDGRAFASTDFVSAIIGLNRLVFNRNASSEMRRKVLYEADQLAA